MTYPILPIGSSQSYRISNSIRIDQSANKYFNRTFGTATTATTWTFSFWFRRGLLSTSASVSYQFFGTSATANYISLGTSNQHNIVVRLGNTSVITGSTTTALISDTSKWYHIVVTTTGGNNHAVYVNGETYATSSTVYTGGTINTAIAHYLGSATATTGSQMDGCLTDVYFVDGQVLSPNSFGTYDQTTGQWVPQRFNGTFGNNGFFLNFADGSSATATALGKDGSPNGNNWTPNNLVVSGTIDTQDWTTETPTPYATQGTFGLASIYANFTSANYPFKGGRRITGNQDAVISFPMYEGKWYMETFVLTGATAGGTIGVKSLATGTNYTFAKPSTSQYYGLRYDSTTGVCEYTTNGTAWTNITSLATLATGPYVFSIGAANNGEVINTGFLTFNFSVPSGYNPVCNVYLTTPTVNTLPMNSTNLTTYTGTGATQSISNAVTFGAFTYQFQPDIVFIASNNTALDKPYYDSVRGATAQLLFNTSAAEATASTGLTSFNSNGFTIGANTLVNTNTTSYLAAQIAIGGSPVTNTSGTITSTVLANTTTGVSIVTWTGTGVAGTIGHGLGVAPDCMIIKIRSTTGVGNMYHRLLNGGTTPHGFILDMSTTANEAADTTYLNNTAPTSSVFSVGVSAKSNTLGATYVAYCFASKTGYSSMNQFTGGSTTAPSGGFGYSGGKIRWAIVKQRTGANLDGWYLVNFAANQNNILSATRLANSATAATTALIGTAYGWKTYIANGATQPMNTATTAAYIFLAFNQAPFIWSNPK